MNPGLFDRHQQQFIERYQDDPSFQHLLSSKANYEQAHFVDYCRLVELELNKSTFSGTKKAMQDFFLSRMEEKARIKVEADLIRSCTEMSNKWSKKLMIHQKESYTTPEDIKTIEKLCRELAKNESDANAILVSFFSQLIKGKKAIKEHTLNGAHTVEEVFAELPYEWYQEPWYYIYVQYFGTDEEGKGTFASLIKMLDYLEALHIKNIYILPHYQSPHGDAGYDISDYKPAEDLGGESQFKAFMETAIQRGFRVATDLVFNHTSAEHPWFLEALKGNSRYFDYYLKCPESWDELKIEEIRKDENGDIYLYLPEKDEKGNPVISKRILIFPDVDETLWLKKKVGGLEKEVLFYREFYPFQIDLDLQNPEVIDELFTLLAQEVSMGVLGKRTDAIAHWIKKPGTSGKDLVETFALQKLIKQFLKHLSSKTIILPEVVTTSINLKGYAGEATTINGHTTTSGGDALLDFQLQGMLREMMYFQKTTPFWSQAHERGEEGVNTSVSLVPIEHHDETYMGFIQEIEAMRDYITSEYTYLDENGNEVIARRGIIYKNGMSGGARYADCLNRDVRRIATAFFCLYMLPAAPVIYYGSEIGAPNQWYQMEKRQKEQYNTLQRLLGEELVGPGKAITFEKCEDPRELQRGPIPAKDFFKALEEDYPALRVVQALSEMRNKKSALRSHKFSDVDTWHESILGMIRFPEWRGEPDKPILVMANLSEQPLTAQVPFTQIQRKTLHSRIVLKEIFRLEGDSPQQASLSVEERIIEPEYSEFLLFDLKPYSAVLFEVY
jgi:maltose alpha-D-glucosyltransferase/alpha-amylase